MNKKQRKQRLKKINQIRKRGRQWWTMEDILYHHKLIDYARWRNIHDLRDGREMRELLSREFALEFKPSESQVESILNKLETL